MRLVKAHALGNDFLLVRSADLPPVDFAAVARAVCHRHRGVGADGLVVLGDDAERTETRLYNSDGSRAEVSGNGIRCVAAWIARERRLQPGSEVHLGTGAGARDLTLLAHQGDRYRFQSSMGQPEDVRQETLSVAGERVTVAVLRVGNPQCVVLGPASGLTEERLATLGGGLAVHPFFPEGTNVELATVESPARVRVLIWERGAGRTEASGTGACAAAVAAAAFGGATRAVDVVSPGGTQHVEWTEHGLWLTGWAQLIGSVDWWGDA